MILSLLPISWDQIHINVIQSGPKSDGVNICLLSAKPKVQEQEKRLKAAAYSKAHLTKATKATADALNVILLYETPLPIFCRAINFCLM